MFLQKFLDMLPAPLLLSAVIFCVFPVWQSALIVIGALSFIAFKDFLRERRIDELKQIREEIKLLKNQIEAVHINRTLGR